MRQFWLVVLPLLIGGFVAWVVWLSSDEPRTRYAFLFAVLGSVLLAYEPLWFSLCGLGENHPQGSQCGGSSYQWVLLGIPVLLIAAWGISTTRMPWQLGALILVFVPLLPIVLHAN